MAAVVCETGDFVFLVLVLTVPLVFKVVFSIFGDPEGNLRRVHFLINNKPSLSLSDLINFVKQGEIKRS